MRNPFVAATERMTSRAASGGGYYAGASQSGLFYDFVMGTLSANNALRGSLSILRNRARELVTKNGTAGAVPQIFSEQVIGESGITYQAAIAAPDGTTDDRSNRALEYHVEKWSEAKTYTVDRSLSRLEVDALITESECVDGEFLLRLVPGFDNAYGFAVELLDPDQLDVSLDREAAPGYNRIVMGVEVDAWGAPLYYHLHSNHPSDFLVGNRLRVPADQIIHRFIRRRVGQLRGVTWFAPALVDFGMHGGWRSASVIASRVAATQQGFYELDDEAEAIEPEEGKSTIPRIARPGMLDQLPKGYKLKEWKPSFPTIEFEQFDSAVLRSLAVAFRVGSLRISGNNKEQSWSGGRTERVNEIGVYGRMQTRHITTVTDPVHQAFIRAALLKGALPEVRSLPLELLTMAQWHPEPFDWPDPEADLNVALAERRAGLTSLQRIARRLGRNLRDMLREIAEENRWAEEEGVTIDVSPVASARAPLYGAPSPNNGSPAPAGADHSARPPLRAIHGGGS